MGETKRSVSVKISEKTYLRVLRLHGELPLPKCSFSALCGHLIEQDLNLIEAGIVKLSDIGAQQLLGNPREDRVVEFVSPREIEITADLQRQLEFNKSSYSKRLLRSPGEAARQRSHGS